MERTGLDHSPRGGVYRFERFTLDTVRGALLAAGGTEVPLRPKAFALLVTLVESAGRLVDRKEIMRAVWPDVVVTDDSISQCVREIRRALGDGDKRFVRTLPRRGFLLAADVERGEATATLVVVPASAVSEPEPELKPRARARTALASSVLPVVTLLPFDGIGGEGEAFADGLDADLATDLTRFCSLQVVRSRRGTGLGRADRLAEAREAVGRAGSYVVSGAVRMGAGRVRVTAQVEDVETGGQLWAERFDCALGSPGDDPFAVQEEVAGHMAALVAAQVQDESRRRALRRPPASLDIYDLCLRGRELHRRTTEADTLSARALFDQAIAADPLYGLAYAWQAYAVLNGLVHLWGEPKGLDASRLALGYARRAVELARDSAFCWSRLVFVLMTLGQHDEAAEAARTAVRLNPRSSDAQLALAHTLLYGDEPEAGLAGVRLALELDPFHPVAMRFSLGLALLVAGQHEEAGVELHQVVAQRPDFGLCWHCVVVWAVETGRMDEARAATGEILRLSPLWTLRAIEPVWCFRDPMRVARWLAAFRAAGLPEG